MTWTARSRVTSCRSELPAISPMEVHSWTRLSPSMSAAFSMRAKNMSKPARAVSSFPLDIKSLMTCRVGSTRSWMARCVCAMGSE